jgi:hypothetical protein
MNPQEYEYEEKEVTKEEAREVLMVVKAHLLNQAAKEFTDAGMEPMEVIAALIKLDERVNIN